MLSTISRYFLSVFALLFLLTGICPAKDPDKNATSRRVTSKKNLKRSYKARNWYVRIKAEAPEHGFVDNSSLLGQIRSKSAANTHSLKALAPFGGDYLYIAFDNPVGVDESGEYKTSFHTRNRQSRREDRWEFTVKSSDPDNDIILSWSEVIVLKPYVDKEERTRFNEIPVKGHPLAFRMKLIDALTFEEVPMDFNNELQSYSFNMRGNNERNFIWVLEKRENPGAVKKRYSRERYREKIAEVKSHAKYIKKYLKEQRIQEFDLDKPPVNEEVE